MVVRYICLDELRFVARLWLLYVSVVALIAAGIAYFGTVTGSVWERATVAPRWFALVWGIYQTAVYLPLFIAHGYTRRGFARHAILLTAIYAAALAALITAGFAIEWVAYGLLGWPQELALTHLLFDAPTQFPLILVQFWLVFIAWITVGALLGAAFYRSSLIGVITVPAGLATLALAESAMGSGEVILTLTGRVVLLPPNVLSRLSSDLALGWPAAAVVYAIVTAAGLGLTWMLIRELPIRGKNV